MTHWMFEFVVQRLLFHGSVCRADLFAAPRVHNCEMVGEWVHMVLDQIASEHVCQGVYQASRCPGISFEHQLEVGKRRCTKRFDSLEQDGRGSEDQARHSGRNGGL
jgi:hypothetical protein